MEIKINTKFEDSDKAFMILENNTFMPVEVTTVIAIDHEVNAYNVDIYRVKYEVKSLKPFKHYSVYEDELYTAEEMVGVLGNW